MVLVKSEAKSLKCESEKIKDESKKIKGESKKIKDESKKIKDESKKIKGESKKTKAENEKANGDEETVEKLTSYQGKRRTFGLFTCPKCSRQWSSAHSWANMGQECFKCLINVYPRRQWKLKKKRHSKVAEPGKNHMDNLCEKCKTIGYPCTHLRMRSDFAD